MSLGCSSNFEPAGGATSTLEPAKSAVERERLWGAQVHPFWTDSTVRDFDRELNKLREARANTVRADFPWASLEPARKGERSPSFVRTADLFLRHAERRKLKVVAVFYGTPCWASSAPNHLKQRCSGAWWRRGVDRYPPTDPRDYADAAGWLAHRWGSRLAGVEIWNEPNAYNFLRSPDPAMDYARLIKAAYPRIKRARPQLTVVGGVLGGADGAFASRLYRRGIKGYFDAFAIHPYSGSRSPALVAAGPARSESFASGIPWIREVMRRAGDDKPIWLTEFGWSTCSDAIPEECVSAETQATYLKEAYCLVQTFPYVEAALLYNLRNNGGNAMDKESNFGLLARDFTPKLAWDSFTAAATGRQHCPPKDDE